MDDPRAPRRRNRPSVLGDEPVYNPATDIDKPPQGKLEQITQALSTFPVISTIGVVFIVSLILNALFLGITVLRQPILFLWMELVGSLALGLGVYAVLRINRQSSSPSLEQQLQQLEITPSDLQAVMVLKDTLGERRETIFANVQEIVRQDQERQVSFDNMDRRMLDTLEQLVGNDEQLALLVQAMIRSYLDNVDPTTRFEPGQTYEQRSRPSRRARPPVFGENVDIPPFMRQP